MRWMIEQAIYGSQDAGGYRFLARSPGFRDEWLAEAERLCTGFGERPAGISCPGCVFAQPFGSQHVAVVQAADWGSDDAGRPGAIGFYVLILPRELYIEMGGDPFHIADRFPPPWTARGELPSLTWNGGPTPTRTVAMLQQILKDSHSATLLGGAQILLDGGRLVFERSTPDDTILRNLWALLPTRERAKLWPASCTFGSAQQFDVVVVPRLWTLIAGPELEHYVTEEKAGDYPEGRYECNLQSAIETGDQAELDALLNYSRSRMLRLIVTLLVIVVVLSFAMARLLPGPRPTSAPSTPGSSSVQLDLPPVNQCPELSPRERTELAERLQQLGTRLHIDLPVGTNNEALAATLETLDRKLGGSKSRQGAKPLADYGPLQRQLRVLLWKHGVAAYNARGLNTVELLERLEEHVEQQRNPGEGASTR